MAALTQRFVCPWLQNPIERGLRVRRRPPLAQTYIREPDPAKTVRYRIELMATTGKEPEKNSTSRMRQSACGHEKSPLGGLRRMVQQPHFASLQALKNHRRAT
jgi:hypothetical protein